MGKLEKKQSRLKERIAHLEEELRLALTRKTSNVKEIDVASHQRKIADLNKELAALK